MKNKKQKLKRTEQVLQKGQCMWGGEDERSLPQGPTYAQEMNVTK